MDSESILRGIGELSRYQIQTYCWILLPILFSAVVYNSQYIFAANTIPYRNTIPEREAKGWGSWAFPESGGQLDRIPSLGEVCTPGNFLQNQAVACTNWIDENDNTIVSEMQYQSKSLPYLIFGVMAACSGLLMLLTPKTLKTKLPNTVYQTENMAPRTKRNTTGIHTNYSALLLPLLLLPFAVYNSQYMCAAGSMSYRWMVPESEAELPNFDIKGWRSWAFPESKGLLDRVPSLGKVSTPGNFLQNLYENDNTIVSEMQYQSKSLPYLIFGVMAACSGLLMLLTPKTLKTKLPSNLHRAKNIAEASRTKRNTTGIHANYCKATL
ncbi:hypothetical protein K1T71_001529 [Dendrolimus kikuchii]|uniref:Uncharacterized protein n=1 Tax=Dendrolimus kikuchii TaxID=765133 RepID=A0ACC1DIS1_9NEOP|nr:hypothetical protein K1T71_001529 [Dendrolimus kikuchii]